MQANQALEENVWAFCVGLVTALVLIFVAAGCSGTYEPLPANDAGCLVSSTYEAWLKAGACCEPTKRLTVIDPCGPGVITYSCSDGGPCQ
jgi:hypothetical protein